MTAINSILSNNRHRDLSLSRLREWVDGRGKTYPLEASTICYCNDAIASSDEANPLYSGAVSFCSARKQEQGGEKKRRPVTEKPIRQKRRENNRFEKSNGIDDVLIQILMADAKIALRSVAYFCLRIFRPAKRAFAFPLAWL